MRVWILRLILAVIIFTTLGLGTIGYLSGEVALRAGAWIYGAEAPELTPQLDYLIKMMGSGLIALGLLNVLAFAHPHRYRHIIIVDAVMLVLRALQRICFAGQIVETFAVAPARLYVNAGIMLAAAVMLVVLALRLDTRGVRV